jgi:hypothetical protein
LRALDIDSESESLETSKTFERLQRSKKFYKSSSILMRFQSTSKNRKVLQEASRNSTTVAFQTDTFARLSPAVFSLLQLLMRTSSYQNQIRKTLKKYI